MSYAGCVPRPLNIVDLPLGLVFTIIAWSPVALPIKLGSEGPALFLQKHAGALGCRSAMIQF